MRVSEKESWSNDHSRVGNKGKPNKIPWNFDWRIWGTLQNWASIKSNDQELIWWSDIQIDCSFFIRGTKTFNVDSLRSAA